jgi:desulfoferrodoxin (superoxide reductase-like protein)
MKIGLFSLVFSLLSVCAFAHPPSNIDISTNEDTVQVTVTHNVNDPHTHYIKTIELSLNGKKIIEQSFSFQYDKNFQKATYFLPALKKGDVLSVDADCNQFGDLSKKYTVQ